MSEDWQIVVVDSHRVKGKPRNWMPSAEALVKIGVPARIALRWKQQRRDLTVGLRRRVRQSRN